MYKCTATLKYYSLELDDVAIYFNRLDLQINSQEWPAKPSQSRPSYWLAVCGLTLINIKHVINLIHQFIIKSAVEISLK